MRKVIVNTTPLIALCHVGQLDLLKKMYVEISIPEAVYRELSNKKESICKKHVDASLDWIHVEKIENQVAKSVFKTQLHDGEVEVMILAKEKSADDERQENYLTFPLSYAIMKACTCMKMRL